MKRITTVGQLEVQTIPYEGGHQVALLDVPGFYAGTNDAVRSAKVFGEDAQIDALHDLIVAAARARGTLQATQPRGIDRILARWKMWLWRRRHGGHVMGEV